jgi:hypothetical protein
MASSSLTMAAGTFSCTSPRRRRAGYTDLVPGVRVSYEIRTDREGNPTAESLRFGIRPPAF